MILTQVGTEIYIEAGNTEAMGCGKPRVVAVPKLAKLKSLLSTLSARGHLNADEVGNDSYVITTKFDINTIASFLNLAATGKLAKTKRR